MTNKRATRFKVESLATIACFYIAILFGESLMAGIMLCVNALGNVILIFNSIFAWIKKEKDIKDITIYEINKTKNNLIWVGVIQASLALMVLCLVWEAPLMILYFFGIPFFCSINIFCILVRHYIIINKKYKREIYKNILGIEETIEVDGSEDIFVTGILSGKLKKGETVYIKNFDEDGEVVSATINKIEVWNYTGKKKLEVRKAKDKQVILRIENGSKLNIKKGSVLFSGDTKISDVYDTYIDTLWNKFILLQNMELSEKDKEQMSVSDCAELWRMFITYRTKKKETEEDKEKNNGKSEELSQLLISKILKAPYTYTMYSKRTGEPYLYSTTSLDEEDGEKTYFTTNPSIILFTENEKGAFEKEFPNCEIRKIEREKIFGFLADSFYLNGAWAVSVIYDTINIEAEKLVVKPDFSEFSEIEVPITNPDLMKWKLLMGQLEDIIENEYTRLLYQIYCGLFEKELLKAKFLVPIKGDLPEEEGNVVLNKDVSIIIPLIEMNEGKVAIKIYTDWKRLRQIYNEEWGAVVQKIDEMTEEYDYAINATEYPGVGCYIDRELFEAISKEETVE